MKNKLTKFEKNIVISLVSLFLMVALGFIVSSVEGGFLGEEIVFKWLGGDVRTPILFKFSRFLAFVGSARFLVPAVLIVVIFSYIHKKKVLAVGIIVGTLGVFILNSLVKIYFQRPRPGDFMLDIERSTSYPSGHTMTNTCLYLFLAYYFSRFVDYKHKKTFYIIAIILSLIMGFSRVYLGVHYLSDVVGGFFGAYGFFILTVKISEWVRTTEKW